MESRISVFSGNPVAAPCPLLAGQHCSIYPIKPIACRRYLVSGLQCKAGEDATITRWPDMIIPDPAIRDEALALLVPWHATHWRELGLKTPPAKGDGPKWMVESSTTLQAVN